MRSVKKTNGELNKTSNTQIIEPIGGDYSKYKGYEAGGDYNQQCGGCGAGGDYNKYKGTDAKLVETITSSTQIVGLLVTTASTKDAELVDIITSSMQIVELVVTRTSTKY